MQHSESFSQVAAALAAAQGAFPPIPRDRTVTVQPRPKRKSDGTEYWPPPYSFSYAPLETILEKVRPALASNDLALLQSVVANDQGAEFVRTMLVHGSGEWFANETPLFTSGADNASQGYASGMTYARRYGVSALLCIAADDDDDGNANEDGERVKRPAQAPGGRGGRQSAPPRQRPEAPAEPRAKDAAADAPAGEGAPLTTGAQRLLEAKAKAAGLTPEQVTAEYGTVTLANLNEVLAKLGARAQDAQT